MNEHLVEDVEATGRAKEMQSLYDEVQVLLGNCVRLFYEADDLLTRSKSNLSK